jgi:hypothetical protein
MIIQILVYKYRYTYIYTHTYTQNMLSLVVLFEETRGEGRGKENDCVNNIEIHSKCVGTRYRKHTESYSAFRFFFF